MIDQKRGLNMEEACEYVGGISRNGMYRLLGEKLLRSYLIGNRRYFLREELDAFLERQMDGESYEDRVLGGLR
jgi:excisionase family DNA binding protein